MILTGKIALVTGASTGMGQAIALALAKQGAKVILTSKNKDTLEETQVLIGENFNSVTHPVDLAFVDGVYDLADFVKNQFGKLDILVNAATVWHTEQKVLANMKYETFVESEILTTMSVGIISPMLLVNRLLPIMPKGSKIVNISHMFGHSGKGRIPYYVSKKALESFSLVLSEELREKGIQVNVVSPPGGLTTNYMKFFPEESMGETNVSTHVIAEKVLDLVNPTSQVTGEIVIVRRK